jgi:lipoate-protein ligase A
MRRLLLTLATPEENLALDEALLEWAEASDPEAEALRVWESPTPLVVVGRSSRVGLEVDQEACARRGIPILRRSSGGAAIVAGPGCLMYAVVLSYSLRPELRDIRQAHTHVLGRLADALRPQVPSVRLAGTSDLVLGNEPNVADSDGKGIGDTCRAPARKFSGNSLRAKRTHLLYHGTLLYDFDSSLIGECLRMPPRQPDYRQSRGHTDFVVNLPLPRELLEQALREAWPTTDELADWPRQLVADLVKTRFSQHEWNLVFG